VFVPGLLDSIVERTSGPALITADRMLSFAELRGLTFRLAAALQNAGAGKGSHIAILLPDSIEYCIAYGAVWSIGAVAVPLHVSTKPDTLTRLLSHSESEFLFLHDACPLEVPDLKKAVPSLRWIASGKPGADANLNNILSTGPTEFRRPDITDTDRCGIFYTSGTTGSPKGIVWNYRHLNAPIMMFEHFLDFPATHVQVCAAPLSHSGGLVYLLGCYRWGSPIVLMKRFMPGSFLRNIEKHRVTMCFLVPAMFSALTRAPEFETADLSSLKWVATFGAMADLESLEKLQARCPDLVIFNGWGMMEAAPPNTLPHLDRDEIDIKGVGFPPPWTEIKVVDDSGSELPAGEVGEVVLKGWVVMEGYYREPELTAETVRDGWLHSGDFGRFDERGYLYIVGRKKDVIIVGGLNVQASEVENILASHPAVAEAAVTAVQDSLRGETVKAHVVVSPGSKTDERELTTFCRGQMEAHKIPGVFEFLKKLPRTSSGKVAKWQLR
jgi:acyl-CoA synthetase (AMP-forming)/AMP-acid ligase II